MIAHDDEFFDNVAALALGVLPAAEAEPLAKHVGICADCRLVYASLRTGADLVGYDAEATGARLDEVSRFRLKSRIMKAVRSEVEPEAPAAPVNGRAATNRQPRPPHAWIAYACAVAAIVIAALDTIQVSSLSGDNDRLTAIANQQASSAAAARGRARDLDTRLAQLIAPGSTSYAVKYGVVVANKQRIVIALQQMPPPPAGKTYQAWFLKKGETAMTPGKTFAPDAGGVALVEVPVDATGVAAVAVSVEPAGGSLAPTSKPAFVRTLAS